MKIDGLNSSDARRILKALGTGSAPAEYARLLLVGQEQWFDVATQRMAETAIDRDFEVRFVRARYGGGKTHFLYCVEYAARDQMWVTSFVLLKRNLVELDRFASFVREVARSLSLPDGTVGLSGVIRMAMRRHSLRHGIEPGKTVSLQTIAQAKRGFSEYCSQMFIAPPFSTALRAAYAATLDGDHPQVEQLQEWLGGADTPVVIEGRYDPGGTKLKLKPLGANLAEEQLRLIAILCQLSGFTGLFIAVDELETIGRLPAQRKANSFQTLRALVDQNNSRRQPPATCLFLAATPEMFEDKDKFPSYKALQDRIETLPHLSQTSTVNYRANVIDLDLTQLDKKDLLAIGRTLVTLYGVAFGAVPSGIHEDIERVVGQVITGKYVMARPRLLCRCVVDLLNGQLSGDLRLAVAMKARALEDEREKELSAR